MKAQLGSDHLNAKITDAGEANIEPAYLNFLRDNGYSVDELLEAHAVKRSESEVAHLVLKVQTYSKPMSHPELDLTEDRISLYCCDCSDFRYRKAADVSDGVSPTECGPCAHIKSVSKVENAKADDSQTELGE